MQQCLTIEHIVFDIFTYSHCNKRIEGNKNTEDYCKMGLSIELGLHIDILLPYLCFMLFYSIFGRVNAPVNTLSNTLIFAWYIHLAVHLLDKCIDKKCHRYKVCINQPDRRSGCWCPACQDVYQPICASDGKTYASECWMVYKSCTYDLELTKTDSKPCGKIKVSLYPYQSYFLMSLFNYQVWDMTVKFRCIIYY